MLNQITATVRPYALHAIPNVVPRSIPGQDDLQRWRDDWQRWLAAWRTPDLCKCGGALVRRRGKRGAFLGCSRYPDCRYTEGAPPVDRSPREERYARYLTKAERAQASVDGKAKRAKKRLLKERKDAKKRGLQPEMVIQLDAENFDFMEWGEEWIEQR